MLAVLESESAAPGHCEITEALDDTRLIGSVELVAEIRRQAP